MQSITENLIREDGGKKFGSVDFIPICWHETVRGEDEGLDRLLDKISLRNLSYVRSFLKEKALDVVLYNNKKYTQTIIRQVGKEMNKQLSIYMDKNPQFEGNVSIVSHSLGSVISFDILCNQRRRGARGKRKRVKFTPDVRYHQLHFDPHRFVILGSPLAYMLLGRGVQDLGQNYHLPTCRRMINIMHPLDVIAHRVEVLVMEQAPDEPCPIRTRPGPQEKIGQLNAGRRIDYVLTKTSLESCLPYISFIWTHSSYWTSRETVRRILQEVFDLEDDDDDSRGGGGGGRL